jgi:hypothetical protein
MVALCSHMSFLKQSGHGVKDLSMCSVITGTMELPELLEYCILATITSHVDVRVTDATNETWGGTAKKLKIR